MDNLVKHYTDLLIVQYKNKPKAYKTIKLLIQILQQKMVAVQVKNGFNINTAVGYQLDIIGQYVNFSRYVKVVIDNKYFGFLTLDNPNNKYIGTLADLDNKYSPQPFISLKDSVKNIYRLNDEDYRNLLKLRIIKNNTNNSFMETNIMLYETFGQKIKLQDNEDMSCTFYLKDLTNTMTEVIKQNPTLLPYPMGMTIKIEVLNTLR